MKYKAVYSKNDEKFKEKKLKTFKAQSLEWQ